jgi:hypothetical protein
LTNVVQVLSREKTQAAHQLLIWDKVLGLGRTDPLAGFATITSNLVGLFSWPNKIVKNVARNIKR